MRNPNVSSAIIGGIHGTRDGVPIDSLMALATLDGKPLYGTNSLGTYEFYECYFPV